MEKIDEIGLLESGAQIVAYPNDILDSNRFVITGTSEGIGATLIETDGLALSDMGLSFVSIPVQIIQENPVHQFITPDCQSETTIYLDQSQLAFLQSGQLLLTENGLLTPVIDQQTIDKNHILLSSIGESIKPINVVTSNGLNTLDLSCLEASGDLLLEGSVGLEQRLATIDEQPQPPSSEDLVISGDSTAVNQEINLSELPPLKDPNSKDILPPLRKGPFKCEICFKEFSQHSKYRKHNQFHLEDKPHKCSACNASFNILSNLTLHKATHQVDRLECPECHKVFSRFASLKAHIMLHEREESLFCTECGDEFGNQVQLDKHIKSHDAEWVKPAARIYKCSSCDKQYSRASVLRQHMKDHFKVKATLSANSYNRAIKRGRMMHSCEVCSKSFQKPSQLIRHNRIHTGEKPFKCDFENCTRSFNQKGSLLIHMMSKHKGLRPFQCQFCSATFSQKGNLRAHVVRLHSIPNTQETVYQCSECSCVFRKLGSLNAHTNRMHPPTPVDHLPVGQKPIDKDNLKLKTQLSPSSKDTSDKENESQENKVSVDFSVQRIITVSNKHEDGTIKQTLMKQRQVGAIKWHQCQACGKEFKKPSDLVRHTRIHTHEKPFQCKSCPRAFSVRSTLVAHTRTHSRQGWDAGKRRLPNPHKCHTCDKNFVSGSALKHHNKTHHNAELNGRNERNAEPILDETYDATGVPAVAPTSAADSTATDSMAATTSGQVPEIDYSQPLLITEQGVVQVVALKEPTRVPVTSEETWDRPHRCAICSLSYRRSNHLKVHMRSHSGERPFTCSVCKRSFKSSGVLKGHLRTHSMLKTHRCHECGKYLSTKGSLLRHRETHSTGLPYKCAYCPRTYKSHATCRKHILTHKGSLVWKSPELNLVEELEEQEYVDTAEGDLEPDDPPEPQGLPEPETGPLPSMPNIDTLIINNPKDMRLQPNTVFASTEPLIISRVDGVSEVALSHTLHADASGTITLPALSGQDGLTQESIRDLEESLNQQLFGSSVSELSLDKEQVVLFDHSFDPCHFPTITLQGDQLEIGQALTSANLAAILPTTEGTATIAEESFSCDHCGGEFSSEADLDKHTLAHIQAPTHTISLQDPSTQIEESISTIHLTSIQAEDVTELRCEVCQERAESAEDLSEHRKTHPSCDICDKAFATTAQHKAHIKSHGREKEFVCEHCGSSFRQLYSLVRHMSIHTPRERNFPCTICGQAFKTLGQLRRHEKAEHRESAARRRRRGDVRQLTEEEATQLAASEPTSVSEQVLKASIAERGRISDVQDPDSVKSDVQHANRCKYCPKSFRKPSDLVRHMRIHTGERPFQCDSCNKCFTVKSTLDSHIKTHNTPKPCVCHVCGFNFATKGSLKVHMRLHTGSRPFRCPVCYQRFRTSGHRKAHLMMHVREAQQTLPDPPSAPSLLPTAASDDVTVVEIDHDVFSALLPQYQCNMCHKVFGKQSVLSRHLRIHTGEKPFQCETCQKCFTQKNSLLIHMRIHSGEREWACGECGAAFTQKCNLVAHSRRHHPPEPLAYTIDLSEDKFPVDLEKVVSDLFPHMRPAKATVDL